MNIENLEALKDWLYWEFMQILLYPVTPSESWEGRLPQRLLFCLLFILGFMAIIAMLTGILFAIFRTIFFFDSLLIMVWLFLIRRNIRRIKTASTKAFLNKIKRRLLNRLEYNKSKLFK